MAEISGTAELRARIASGIARQREQLIADLDVFGAQMVEAIRAAAPKRTGALAASVRHEVVATPDGVRLQIVVGNDTVFYAPYVEFGTGRECPHGSRSCCCLRQGDHRVRGTVHVRLRDRIQLTHSDGSVPAQKKE